MSYYPLSYLDVALAAALILINGIVSVALRLRMERSLFLASVRTTVQLLLVGFVLQWVFAVDRWYVVVAMLLVMTLIAGYTAAARNERRFAGMWTSTLLSMGISSWIITAYALLVVLRGIDQWYQPQYAIPLMGMVLGNTLNGISVGLGTLTSELALRRGEIDSAFTLGATRYEAALPTLRQAIRLGMTPIINSMMVVGLVSLPGMMTGQLLSGTSPIEAVKYQIMIMFLVASATALGTVGVVALSYLHLFSSDHQFLFYALQKKKD
jgi:putative ABC transport system permease protein